LKKLLVTDSHLGIGKSSDLDHDVVFNLFQEISEVCLTKDIKTVIHLGDFFHDRKVLNTKSQNIAHLIEDLFTDVAKIYLILGNHDVYYKDRLKPTAAELFNHPDSNIIPVDTVMPIDDDIVLCPWGLDPQGYSGFLMGHFELTGFKMNSSYICDRGQDPNSLTGWKQVLSGHFHTPSTQTIQGTDFTYLGSPYQQTFHDINSPRGYYIWEDGDMEFIEFKYAPQFVIQNAETINTKTIKNNIIRLVFNIDHGSIKNQKIIDEVMSFGPNRVQIDFSNVKIEGSEEQREEDIDASLLDHNEIITEYIDKTPLPDFIKKNVLRTMIEKLREDI
jgi:DNA repair exonuclease SbcCD nuclease subunit